MSFPGCQLNAASRKSQWKFNRPVSQNEETFWTENLLEEGFKVLSYHMKVETRKKR